MSKKIKTRFAPSPTGYLHIGGLRGALYAYLFAKQHRGKFVLRIEDTDQSRYVKDAEKDLISTLQKIGLDWDEGPWMDKSLVLKERGQNGPYFQLKRVKIYQGYAQKLIDNNQAYYCFCSSERLEKLRKSQQAKNQPPKYDGCCRTKNRQPKNGEKFVIRLKVPASGEVKFNDLIRGEVKFQMEDLDDQILLKSDSFPTYHLAVVVDDYLMGISHVIRGEEWISSTPKHILLYQALNWPLPTFGHLPLLLNKDRSKLSKRQGDISVEDYLTNGYLPEALINYVALLGWHPKDDREIFSLKDLIKHFDLSRVQKGGAIFDLEKLNWFNSYYLRKKPVKELIKLSKQFFPDIDQKILTKVLTLEKERLENLGQLKDLCQLYLKLNDYPAKLLVFKKSDQTKTLLALTKVFEKLEGLKKWKQEKINKLLSSIVKKNNLTNGDVFWSVRMAVSGQEKSPPPEEIMEILGKAESLNRIKIGIEKINNEKN